MTSVVEIDGDHLVNALHHLSIQYQGKMMEISEHVCEGHDGICAICLDEIELQEIALVKGCEHAYCVTCILRWVTYSPKPTCPQCKLPFESLNVHRSLDGSIHDCMFEESVCLLLRATWFKPLCVEEHEEPYEDAYEDALNLYIPEYEFDYEYEDDDDDLEEVYGSSSSNLRIGNRRWGDNGYVRAGRQEARPVHRSNANDSGAGSSCEPKSKGPIKDKTGRRAKRTLRREAEDRAAAVKHQQHLARLGRK